VPLTSYADVVGEYYRGHGQDWPWWQTITEFTVSLIVGFVTAGLLFVVATYVTRLSVRRRGRTLRARGGR